MAARPKSGISIDTDVNLDFLTKEEKEALLSKKMDMIRQRNKALTERHQLIEADKKKAEEAGQAVKPTVDSQMLPAEGAPKPRGRGRGQTHNKDGNRPMKERPKSSGDLRDSSNYEPIVDTTDLANYRSKGHGGLHEREAPNNMQKSKKKSKEESISGYLVRDLTSQHSGQANSSSVSLLNSQHRESILMASVFSSCFEYEPIIEMKDLDKRFGPLFNIAETTRMWPRIDHGPPPDPSFNPLADRRRSDKKEDVMDHRRHPRNYGGATDLSRVKQNMKNLREKEKERPQGSKPLDIVMTGKERRNHEDWKAERERYDKERIQRQMSDGGNWKRAWDADKFSLENEEQSSYSLKMEPAKRPAGRIGSGRFDRGERDDHPRTAVLVKGTLQHADHLQQQQQQQWPHHEQQQLPAQIHQHHSLVGENKPSRGRGRGRGRGRSRGGSGEKFPRPRTWSGGDDRFVECQKELLLVKFDNTAGDNSVEVEYDDDEFLPSPPNTSKSPQPQPATTQGRGPTGRTPNQTPKQQARGGKPQPQKSKTTRHKDNPEINAQQISTEGKWNHSTTPPTTIDQVAAAYGTQETHVYTSDHSQGFRDGEEWEDDTESCAAQEENDSGISSMVLSSPTTSSSIHDLHLECRLNPEAPEFLPSFADLIKTPTGPANTSSYNSGSRSSSPLSQDSAFSPQLTPRLSTSPHTHSAIQVHELPAQLPLLKNEMDAVLKNDQPPTVPFHDSSAQLPLLKKEVDAVLKDNQPPPVLKDNQPPLVLKDNQPPPVLKDNQPPPVLKDNQPPPVLKDNQPPPVLKDNQPPLVLKDNQPPPVLKDNQPPPVLKDNQPPLVLKDNQPPLVLKDNQPPLVLKDNQPPPVLKDNQPPLVLKDNQPPLVLKDNQPPLVLKDNQPPPVLKDSQPPPVLKDSQPPLVLKDNQPPTVLTNNQPPPVLKDNQPPPVLKDNQPPPVLKDSQPPPVLKDSQPPLVLKDNQPPTVLTNNQPPPVLKDSQLPPVLKDNQPPPVLKDNQPPTVLKDNQPPPVLKNNQIPPVPLDESSAQLPLLEKKVDKVLINDQPLLVSLHESPAQLPLLEKKVATVVKNDQPQAVPCEGSQLLAGKQANFGDQCDSEALKPKEKSSEITDGNVSCLTSNGRGSKDTMITSNDKDRANVLSDASSKVRKDALESIKVALSPDKTATGNISASHPKRMTQNSLSEDSKNIPRESASSLAAERTQDSVVAKHLLRDVSRVHGSSEGTSEPVTNGDGSDKQKLNGVSADLIATHEHGVAAGNPKEDSNRQEDLKEPAAAKTANISGPCDPSQVSELLGSQNAPNADESTLPTADISALS